MLFGLAGCYIEGGGCNGPLCFGVSSGSCSVGSICEPVNSAPRGRCPDADEIQFEAERIVAQLRGRDGRCNGVAFGSVPALVWSDRVFSAADRHALDMAAANFVSRTGSDGLDVGVRLRAAGVSPVAAAQLVAAGFSRTDTVFSQWLAQRVPCGQLRDPVYTDMALACRADNDSDLGTYWSLVLASLGQASQ